MRLGVPPALVGESAPVAGIYAHSNWLDDDSHYLYAFEEFNVRDIGVYDVSNPASPTQVDDVPVLGATPPPIHASTTDRCGANTC